LRLTKHDNLIFTLQVGDKLRLPELVRGEPQRFGRQAGVPPLHDADIREYRYTVHPSLGRPGNRINLHVVLKNGRKIELATASMALKASNGFACLFSRRATHQTGLEINDPVSGPKLISLGSFEESFTLHFTVLVGPHDRKFNAAEQTDVNIIQHNVGNFRLVVLWSFFPMPATPNGSTAQILLTEAGSPVDPRKIVVTLPLTEETALATHRQVALAGFDELVSTLLKKMMPDKLEDLPIWIKMLMASKRLLKFGLKDSPEFQAYLKEPREELIPAGKHMHVKMLPFV
jgi:hypothetical protein